MSRALPLIVVVLLALLLLGRARRVAGEGGAVVLAAPAAVEPTAVESSIDATVQRAADPPEDPTLRPDTPELDRLVVLASRQRLLREQRYTYIDSLLATTDSVVRRWEDRNGRPFRVALVDAPDLPGWRPTLPTMARRAFAAWQEVYPELRFEVVADPAGAEIAVRWVEKFEMERTGQTDLAFLPTGPIQRADIQLALQRPDGQPLLDIGLGAVAMHEVGHALGLPHSGNPRDVMFPDTRTGTISSRDRATLVLLYAVAPGSLRLDR
ncbi:MAG: matrixin family metalloprotease [Gemmatimonadota bacterium]|nr:matrixin family metalloprotease [Gemmatimonadota bacterium]